MTESSLQRFERLLGSLAVLAEREEMLVVDKHWDDAAALQERMLTVTEAIVPLAEELKSKGAMTAALQAKTNEIMDRQHRTLDLFSARMKEIGESFLRLTPLVVVSPPCALFIEPIPGAPSAEIIPLWTATPSLQRAERRGAQVKKRPALSEQALGKRIGGAT